MSKKLISIKQACALFGVTPMTLYLWRTTGLGDPKEKIPHEPAASGRGAKFPYAASVAWAKRHGHTPTMTLEQLRTEVVAGQPGRRPQAEA